MTDVRSRQGDTQYWERGRARDVSSVGERSCSGVGLLDPGYTPNPTQEMADGLYFQDYADEHNAIVILPESKIWEMMGFEFFM